MKKITVLVLLLLSILSSSLQVNASSTEIVGPDVIHKQSNQILTVGDILALYTSNLGAVAVSVDNYTGYGNILGTKSMSLYATDGTTVATKDIEIIIVSSLGDVKAVTDYKNIHLKTTQLLTPVEIVYVLENTGYVSITASTQMLILSDTYTQSQTVEGSYLFEFRLVNSAGLDQIYTSMIYVSDDDNLFIPDVIFEAPPSAFGQVWQFIVSIFYIAVFVGVGYVIYKVVSKPRKKV